MQGRSVASARNWLGKPAKVLELAVLATVISPSTLVVTTAGTSQVLSQEGSEALPLVYVLLAVVSIPLASGISAALGRWRTSRICRAVCWASLLLCLTLRATLALEVPGAPQAICVAAYVLEILFDTLFWLTVSEYLTTLELKRHSPFLAMAFGVGGIFGGFLATAFCARLPADDLLLLNAGLFGVCLIQFMRIDRTLQVLAAETDAEQEAGIVTAVRSTFVVLRAFPLTAAIASGIFLMSSLFCLQDYLALTIYAENIPDEDSLASFMAMSYAGQQVAELLILAVFGRLVLERAGPLVRNLFFPLATVAALVALQSFWILPIAVLVHVNANAVSNAIFEPVKNLNYAALPFRMLGPVRMLVEGVVYPAGVALSGAALLWVQTACEPNAVLAVAIVLSMLFATASGLVGVAFLPSLLRSLRLRAVTPAEYSNSAPGRRFSRSDVRYLLLHPDPEARRFGRDLARRLAPTLLGAEERRTANACVSRARAPSRRPSTRGLSPEWSIAPCVSLAGGSGAGFCDPGGSDCPCFDAAYAGVHGQCRLAARTPELADLERGLEHPLSSVRRTAAWLLALNGDAAVAAAARALSSDRPEVVEAAIRALGTIRTRKARRVLRDYLRPLYRQARLNLAGLDALQHLGGAPAPASACNDLAEGLADSNRRILSKVLAVKSALGNRRDINLLRNLAQTDEARVRSDAVEALASLPTGGLIRPLLPLLDANRSTGDGVTPKDSECTGEADPAVAVWRAAADDRWISLLAVRVLGDRQASAQDTGDEIMLDLVLFLKSVPLFRALSFEDIARIAEKTETVSIAEGQILFRTGEPITHVYVVRSGSIELSSKGMIVDIMKTGTSIGEHAIFGHPQHEVSASASADCLLLRFPVGLLADLVAEHPQSLGPIASDLIRRVHLLYAYLAEMRKGPGQESVVGTAAAVAAGTPSIDRIVMA
jgi:CRP-like cAMP-binding protein